MKTNILFIMTLLLIMHSTKLQAGSVSDSIAGESLITAPPVESISVALNYDEAKREIKDNSGNIYQLGARSYSFLLGYDVFKWCTIFATVGRSEARLSEREKFGDGNLKWSAGINANLWHVNIEEPPLFTGRISLKPTIEYARYNSEFNNDTMKWTDISGALFLSYEKIIDDPKYNITTFYGYTIYGGPAVSIIDGSVEKEFDFKENRNFGFIGGLDFFITENVSLGGQIQFFEKFSFGGNFRYHF